MIHRKSERLDFSLLFSIALTSLLVLVFFFSLLMFHCLLSIGQQRTEYFQFFFGVIVRPHRVFTFTAAAGAAAATIFSPRVFG